MLIEVSGKMIEVDPAQLARDLDRAFYEDSLYEFLKAAWPYIDPAPFVDGWAAEAVAEHAQAVIDGDIKRLLVNIPPRCLKSSLLSVALPAWTWAQPWKGPTSGPKVPFLYASYARQLSLRDSRKSRQLIESPWYQALWGDRFRLASDSNTIGRFTNDKGGERLVTSVGSAATGEGGNIIVADDPNAADEALSEATTESTIDWWDGTMSTRLNDPKTGAFIVVQQRLGEDDLTGHIVSKDDGEWTHLVLPMRYEPERSFVTGIGWKDPRTEPGELLWPARFGEPEVKALERSLGPWKSAGQLQQRPEPAGGGIIKRDWWQLWENPEYPPFDFILASLDTAYTEKKENDPSALTVWGVFSTDPRAVAGRIIGHDGRPVYAERVFTDEAPKVMLIYGWEDHLEFHDLLTVAAHICGAPPENPKDPRYLELTKKVPKFPVDMLLIEAKANGINVAQEVRRVYASNNFGVRLHDPGNHDKVARMYSVQHMWSDGTIFAPDTVWAEGVISKVATFPKGRTRDTADTCSQAMRYLRDTGMLVRVPERLQEIEDMKQFHGRPPGPLYPV